MKKLLFFFIAACFIYSVSAAIRYVKPNAESTAWSDKLATDVYTDINAAFSATTKANDQIWIAEGKYELASFTIPQAGISIYGGFSGKENSTEDRTKSSQQPWDFTHETIITTSSTNTGSLITINKNNVTIDGINFADIVTENPLTILNYGSSVSAACIIQNCKFMNNESTANKGTCVLTYNAVLTVKDSYFFNNYANHTGAAIIYPQTGTVGRVVTVQNCFFDNNKGLVASSIRPQGNTAIINCIFTNHIKGTAIYSYSPTAEISNCIIYNNKVQAIYLNGGSVTNSIMLNNEGATYLAAKDKDIKYSNNITLNCIGMSIVSGNTTAILQNNLWDTDVAEIAGRIDNNTHINTVSTINMADYLDKLNYIWTQETLNALSTALKTNTPSITVAGVALSDKGDFSCTHLIDAPATYTRNCFTDGGWETIILPFDVTSITTEATDLDGELVFEEFSKRSEANTSVTFAPVEKAALKANVPYLMKYNGTAQATGTKAAFVFNGTGNVQTAINTTDFIGTYTKLNGTADVTGYAPHGDGTTFGKIGAATVINPFRAYLSTPVNPASAPIRYSVEHDGGATGVDTANSGNSIYATDGVIYINTDQTQTINIYTIDGRKMHSEVVEGAATVNGLPQGIYIVNNQKVVIK